VGHIVKGALDLKAANALKEAAKENQGLVSQLNVDPNDQSLFGNPDLLGQMPNIPTYDPYSTPLNPVDAGSMTGNPIPGNDDFAIDPELEEDKKEQAMNLDGLREQSQYGNLSPERGSLGELGSSGALGGFNDTTTAPETDPSTQQPVSAGDIGKYKISQGGAGVGIPSLNNGRKERANPEQIKNAFDSLIKGIIGDSQKLTDTGVSKGNLITSNRDPASNKNVTGDESINITSKSLFEIISERIQISKRSNKVHHPDW